MTQVLKVTSPRSEEGNDPNDSRKDRRYLKKIEEQVIEKEKEKKAKFPFVFSHEMSSTCETEYTIDGFIEDKTANLLYAPKDHLKSFVASDMAMSVASGKDWHGFTTQGGPCVYICGEGHSGMDRRFKAWAIKHQVDLEDIPIVRSKWPMQVLDAGNVKEWAENIKRVVDHYGEKPKLIVIDTLATNFGPGSENDPSDMSQFIAHIKIYLSSEFECAVLIVHHTGKNHDLGARGGSSIEGDSDAVYYIKRDKEEDQLIELHCKHIKDAEKPPVIRLKAEVVELGYQDKHGREITSLVLSHYLTDQQIDVLELSQQGYSQRSIATRISRDKKVVSREQKKLREMGLLGVPIQSPAGMAQGVPR